jgi:hypothetical protein
MRTVLSLLVVELAPALDQDARFRSAAEPLAVEQLVAQLAVEVLDDAVLPRAARRDERRSDRLSGWSSLERSVLCWQAR